MEISRRDFLSAAIAGAAVLSIPAVAAGVSAQAAPSSFSVQLTREYLGDGEFGSVMGGFARGHHSPQDMARGVIDELYADGAVEDVFPTHMVRDDGDLLDEQAAVEYLAPRIRHVHGEIETSDADGDDLDDGSWIFRGNARPGSAGSFPATVIDL